MPAGAGVVATAVVAVVAVAVVGVVAVTVTVVVSVPVAPVGGSGSTPLDPPRAGAVLTGDGPAVGSALATEPVVAVALVAPGVVVVLVVLVVDEDELEVTAANGSRFV